MRQGDVYKRQEYTLGENMTQAFWHTVIGMGTVFVVLILISLIISCFKFKMCIRARYRERAYCEQVLWKN